MLDPIEIKTLSDLIERLAEYDCFQPWGVPCSQIADSGEIPCESCEAKAIINQISKSAKPL